MPLLEPVQEITLPTRAGERTYRFGSFPAIAGREIVTQYPTTAMPKIGDYKTNEELMLKVLSYVERQNEDGSWIQLTTRSLIDNHVPDFETLIRLEWATIKHNCDFFNNGALSGWLDRAVAAAPKVLTSLMSTVSSQQSSGKASPPSTS